MLASRQFEYCCDAGMALGTGCFGVPVPLAVSQVVSNDIIEWKISPVSAVRPWRGNSVEMRVWSAFSRLQIDEIEHSRFYLLVPTGMLSMISSTRVPYKPRPIQGDLASVRVIPHRGFLKRRRGNKSLEFAKR